MKEELGNLITITKVAITGFKEDLLLRQQMCGLELGFSEEIRPDGNFDHVRETPKIKLRNFFVHADLIEKFVLLSQHLAIIAEYKHSDQYEDDFDLNDSAEVCQRVYCTSATMTGSHERAGAVIEGFKLLENGKKVKLTAPNIEFGGYSGYPLEQELSDLMDELSAEAMLAFQSNKRLIVQTELNFDEMPDEASDALSREIGKKKVKAAIKKMKDDAEKDGYSVEFS